MKILCLPLILALSLAATPILAAPGMSAGFGGQTERHIVVNNRILASVNGKAISVIDVMKKMDVIFYKQYPEYSTSTEARHQFYMINWQYVLEELINKELLLADAEESKMEVSSGDVRQEIEQLFGPDIHANLDKIGMTYEEASRMVQGDITLRRILFVRVNAKALKQLTPQLIKQEYEAYAKDHIRDSEWIYRTITIKDRSQAKAAEAAHQTHHLLSEEKVDFAGLSEQVKKLQHIGDSTTITVSDELRTNDKDLAAAYKEALASLEPDHFSVPLLQKSRDASQKTYRIFFLKEKIPGGPVPFSEVESIIKEKILAEAMDKESAAYLTKLKQHFDVHEAHLSTLLAEGYVPFTLE